MNWLNDSSWMQSPTIRLAFYVALSVMPIVTSDVAEGHASWLTLCLAITAALTTAKAFMAQPDPVPQTKPKE